MSNEEIINHIKIKKANLEQQNRELGQMPFDETYQIKYENEIRIDVLNDVLEYLGG